MFTRHRHDPPDKLNCPHAMRPGAPPRVLERLGEPGFQELAQLGCHLELWNGIEFLECGSERIRKTPDRPRPEFLVLRLVSLCCRQHKRTLCGAEIYVASASGCT